MKTLKYIPLIIIVRGIISLIIFGALFGCEPPRELSRKTAQTEAAVKTREGAIRSTEERLNELDENISALKEELREENIKSKEEVYQRIESIEDKRFRLEEIVEQYNSAILGGSKLEAADLNDEINRRIDEIYEDVDFIERRKNRMIRD